MYPLNSHFSNSVFSTNVFLNDSFFASKAPFGRVSAN